MLDGMRIGMEVTGVPGIFTREYVTPGIDGMDCPADPLEYVPDVEKNDNQWVRVGEGGAVEVYDPEAQAFTATDHKVAEEFVGYCWLDNVSQDEYAGHMLALATVILLVEDAEARAVAVDLLGRVGDHLLEHDMALQDWDGRTVEHGRFWPYAMDNFPGFNAVLGLSYVKMAAVATGREDLRAHYEDCLLQRSGPKSCIDQPFTRPEPYTDALPLMGLYPDDGACKANWNNFAMAWVAFFMSALASFASSSVMPSVLTLPSSAAWKRVFSSIRTSPALSSAAMALTSGPRQSGAILTSLPSSLAR